MSNAAAPPFEIKRTLGFLVTRSQRLMGQQLEAALSRIGLNVQQFVAVELLYEGLASGPSDVAKTLGLDTGSATRLADQLSDKGLAVRERDACDRRQVSLVLTDAGRAAAVAAQAIGADLMQTLLAGFDDVEAEEFLSYLNRLVTRLEERADA